MKHSAFTLIELLVVIAIIAILAGIALPVFGKVQERSRAVNCAANLKQIGTGMLAYLNDHDDQLFLKDGKDETSWPRLINPKYVPNWKVFRSPFDKPNGQRLDSEKVPGAPVSYGINEFCFKDTGQGVGGAAKTDGANTSKYVAPSQLVLMGPAMEDNDQILFLGTSESHPMLKKPEPGQGQAGGVAKRGTHFNRAQLNVMYADWHVGSLSYREFTQAEDEDGLKRWYPGGTDPNK